MATKINGFDLVKVGQGWELAPKSTLPVRIKSVGKNLFDKNKVKLTNIDANNLRIETTTLQPNTQYYFNWDKTKVSGTHAVKIIYGNIITNIVFNSSTPTSFTTNELNEYQINFYFTDGISAQNIQNILDSIQIEEGTTATEYEEYKESVSYITLPEGVDGFHSLPNGTKDEVKDGKLYKRCSNKIVLDGNIPTPSASGTTTVKAGDVYYVILSNWLADNNAKILEVYETYGDYYNGIHLFESKIFLALMTTTYGILFNNSGNLYIIIDKAYIDTNYPTEVSTSISDGVIAYLTDHPIPLIYQLAEPVTYDLDVTPLTAFEKGTVIIEPFMSRKFVYNNGISWTIPVSSIETIEKVATGEIITDYTLATDGLSVTITGAVNGEEYIVKAPIKNEYSTIPSFSAKYQLNKAAQTDSNTIAIARLSEIVADILIRM